jgi:hypothetical protein
MLTMHFQLQIIWITCNQNTVQIATNWSDNACESLLKFA